MYFKWQRWFIKPFSRFISEWCINFLFRNFTMFQWTFSKNDVCFDNLFQFHDDLFALFICRPISSSLLLLQYFSHFLYGLQVSVSLREFQIEPLNLELVDCPHSLVLVLGYLTLFTFSTAQFLLTLFPGILSVA